MIGKKKIVAVIPARGGSKGLPNKNIINLAGKPLIAYTIQEALKSRYIDKVLVTTDCPKIAGVSRKYGAEVPFMRPKSLAGDKTHTPPVIIHAVKFLEAEGEKFDYVLTLQPTSPLRTKKHIEEGIRVISQSRFTSLISVKSCDYPPYWMIKVKGEKAVPVIESGVDYFRKERQQLPSTYQVNGALYITKRDTLIREKVIISENCGVVIMDNKTSLDIDTIEDLRRIEKVMKAKSK